MVEVLKSGALQTHLPGVRFIHLSRRDIFAQAVSFAIARQTDKWTSHGAAQCVPEYDRAMLRDCLNAFVREDVDLALHVVRADAAVDDLLEQVFRELLSYMAQNPDTITRALRVIFISKYLERVADHATNIAEDVVYLVEGEIIRHKVNLNQTYSSGLTRKVHSLLLHRWN